MSERVVVVGAGAISNAWFTPLMEENVDVAAVVDINLGAAKSKVEQYGLDAEVSTDLENTIDKTRPDFVLDLTVPHVHCAVTTTALLKGCHVIGEKPMATSMEEARSMVKISERTSRLYMVSQSRRWDVKHDTVRLTVESGGIGDVTTINCDFYIGAHFGGFRDEMPSPLILDMAIHHFDLARFMSGADPIAVYAREFNPKGSWYKGDVAASCIFEMSNGVIFTYRGSWCAEGCHTSWNGDWRIIGNSGTLIYEHDNDPCGQVVAGEEGFHRPLMPLEITRSGMQATGMHGALLEMLEFLRTGRKPQTECHDNIRSLAMVLAAIESSRTGERVVLDE